MEDKASQLDQQLVRKRRSVADLVRYVGTKAGKNANYALLLGAGCSVSSGVRSAGELVEMWAREVCLALGVAGVDDVETARKHLRENCQEWYDDDRAYSSLFEKRFDLPSQRRAFVEEEVGGKLPSLGYAYLIRLIEQGYFNTVFTTNFDDLLNEAFHLFASRKVSGVREGATCDLMRPIVCAHDSSVGSVSISSARPKIVKLHGDYLFDDIKSTLRETETLEENIRDKFVEFCKEYGLVVVGYSGGDRSVMDVLNYLLRSDDYLKNGVYWCLRKGDVVSDELRKLLWKERVYYVYIDGFDELVAELYAGLVSLNEPPVSFVSLGMNNQVLRSLCENAFLEKSPSETIVRDIRLIREEQAKNVFSINVRESVFPSGGSGDFEGVTLEQSVLLMEVDRLLDAGKDREALDKINECGLRMADEADPVFRIRLGRLEAIALHREGRTKEALAVCDRLIGISTPASPEGYFFKNRFLKTFDEKIENLRGFVRKWPCEAPCYEKIADLEFRMVMAGEDDGNRLARRLLEDLDQGLAHDPSIGNDCYLIKHQFLLKTKDAICSDWMAQDRALVEKVAEMNPRHPTYYAMRLMTADYESDSDKRRDGYEEVWREIQAGILDGTLAFGNYFAFLLHALDHSDDREARIGFVQDQILKAERGLRRMVQFNRLCAKFWAYRAPDSEKTLQSLKLIPRGEFSKADMFFLLDLMKLAGRGPFADELLGIYGREKETFRSQTRDELAVHRAMCEGRHKDAFAAFQKVFSASQFPNEHFTDKMHLMLFMRDFKGVYDASHARFDGSSWNNGNTADIVNYQIARSQLGKTVKKERLEPMVSGGEAPEYAAAALILLGREDEACRVICDSVRFDYEKLAGYGGQYVFLEMGTEKVRAKVEACMEDWRSRMGCGHSRS